MYSPIATPWEADPGASLVLDKTFICLKEKDPQSKTDIVTTMAGILVDVATTMTLPFSVFREHLGSLRQQWCKQQCQWKPNGLLLWQIIIFFLQPDKEPHENVRTSLTFLKRLKQCDRNLFDFIRHIFTDSLRGLSNAVDFGNDDFDQLYTFHGYYNQRQKNDIEREVSDGAKAVSVTRVFYQGQQESTNNGTKHLLHLVVKGDRNCHKRVINTIKNSGKLVINKNKKIRATVKTMENVASKLERFVRHPDASRVRLQIIPEQDLGESAETVARTRRQKMTNICAADIESQGRCLIVDVFKEYSSIGRGADENTETFINDVCECPDLRQWVKDNLCSVTKAYLRVFEGADDEDTF